MSIIMAGNYFFQFDNTNTQHYCCSSKSNNHQFIFKCSSVETTAAVLGELKETWLNPLMSPNENWFHCVLMMNSICSIVLLLCFPQVWACWWHGCLTPTTWTSWWWASLTACPLKALWRSWVDQTWIKPLWLHRRANARAAKREWLSTFAPNWLDLGTLSLKAIKSNDCESHLLCFEIGTDLIFFFPRSLEGAGIQTRTRSKAKRKGVFCDGWN